MKWTYALDQTDHDEMGNWRPRIVWADGMVTMSGQRIHGSRTFAEALAEVGQWNWWSGRSSHDSTAVLQSATQHNATLTTEGYWND